jgi:hypothetical protein
MKTEDLTEKQLAALLQGIGRRAGLDMTDIGKCFLNPPKLFNTKNPLGKK